MNILVLCDNKEIFERVSPIFLKRKEHHFTITNSDDINPKVDYAHIVKYYDLAISVHCKKIFPAILHRSIRCVNVHPGLNPFNRGIYPHVFSIVNGLPAGVTIHEMTDEIDLGPCIAQVEVKVKDCDTSGTLYTRIIDCEMELLDYMLPAIIENKYKAFNYFDKGNYNSMEDFKKLCDFGNAEHLKYIFDRMRALSHPGYMNAHINGTKFKLIIDANENITTN